MKTNKIDLKTYRFVENLLTLNNFKERAKIIRHNNKIPNGGFDLSYFDDLVSKEKYPRIPKKINKEIFLADVKSMLKNYNLSSNWLDFFSDYILYKWIGDYFDIEQIITLDLGTHRKDTRKNKDALDMAQNFDLNPIALLLPVSLSIRELEDYIEKNYKNISKLQKRYVNNAWQISKMRPYKSKNKLRDIFIYKNRDLPKKELFQKISENFGQILDYTYINKIIKQQKKRKGAGI